MSLDSNGRGQQEFPKLTIRGGQSLREYLDSVEEKEWKLFVPSAQGYVFGGWYQDQACTLPYDPDAPVTEDTVLYARWIRQYQAEALQEFTDQAVPYNRPEEGEPEAGTLLNPYRYLRRRGRSSASSFMEQIKEEAKKALQADPGAHIYFALEVYEGDSLSGKLKGFWLQDAAKLAEREFPENWRGILHGESGTLEEILLTPTETPVSTETPEPTEAPEVTEKPSPSEKPEGEAASLRTFRRTGEAVLTAELAPGMEAVSRMAETDPSGGSSLGLLPEGGTYTKEELSEAIREQEERLADLQLDLKQSDLKIRSTEKAVEEGAVLAKISGVVKKAGDPADPPRDGSAFLQVASTEGMYIRGGISELMLDRIREGDTVNVTAWESGTYCQAEIREISPYPDESGMFSGYYGTASASVYPFIAYVAEGGDTLISQEWVQLDAAGSGMEQTSEDLYLWKAFILEEDGRQYVYLRDKKGKLRKQEIVTGRRSGEGYQVLSRSQPGRLAGISLRERSSERRFHQGRDHERTVRILRRKNMLENIRLSFQGIWSHKLRSFLTMLGVIIGIAAIIAIVSTISGTNEQIKQNLIGAGNNNVKVTLMQGGGEYWMDNGAPAGVYEIGQEQQQEIRELPHVESASFYRYRSYVDGVASGEHVFSGGSLYGVDRNYLDTVGYLVYAGRPSWNRITRNSTRFC